MAEYTGSQSSSVSVVPEVEYIVPTISNVQRPQQNYGYPVVYTPQPQVFYTTPMQPQIANQPQPQVNQTNNFAANLASKYINNIEQKLQDKENEQTNAQQVSSAANTIQQKMVTDAGQKLTNIYEGQKKAEEDKQKEFERLKEENERFKKEEEARKQKEENDKKLEDERSKIENQQEELEEREGYITLMEKNALINKDEFDKDIEQINIAKDIKAYSSELDASYEQQYQMNNKRKEQQSKIVSDIDKGIYGKAEKLDRLNEKLNEKKARENIFVKIINFITGHKDKESEKIKEEIEKLSKKIEEEKINADEQREELKKIEKEGIEIMRKRAQDMAKNSQMQMDELKERRKQYGDIVNSDEYKNQDKGIYKNYVTNILKRRGQQVDLIQAMANKRNKDIYNKYDIKRTNQERPGYSMDTVNQTKKRMCRY